MQEQLAAIVAEVEGVVPALDKRAAFEAFKATISGPNGKLTAAMKGMKDVPKEDKPAMGKLLNETKQQIEALYAETLARLEAAETADKLGPPIDPTLPCPTTPFPSLTCSFFPFPTLPYPTQPNPTQPCPALTS